MNFSKITTEEVNAFLNGSDPMERIITIECDYQSDSASIIYINENGEKRIKKEPFKPFVWVKLNAATSLFEGNRNELKNKMHSYGIGVKKLNIVDEEHCDERIKDGYKFMFFAKRAMTYQRFLQFFNEGGVPIYNRKKKGETQGSSNKDYLSVSPVEQFMISTGKRLFKGYENYNDLNRCFFDLETQGLNPQIHRIEQIGIRTNHGFEKLLSVEGNTKEEKDKSEIEAIDTFIRILSELKPDTIVGHNSENFDWDFIITRCDILGYPLKELSLKYFKHPIYKKNKETVLKLGGEVEYFKPTIIWGHIVLDSLHAARRAQAIDSNMKKSNLKYVTKYLNLQKENRVYVPGDKITKVWAINDKVFAFNDENGDWYKVSSERPLEEGYEMVSGHYIVERYLLDDVWETDKVEEKLNESNFLVGKLLPTTFSRACTMGTAGIWKLIMLAWSYENDLVVPGLGIKKRFTGGLSRLLVTGAIGKQAKLDFNSLYPSIILTWNINNEVDETGVLNQMLNFVLSQREKYKQLKGEAGAKVEELKEKLQTADESEKHKIKEEIAYWKSEKSGNDKKQLPLKILGNSYFGSAGNPAIWPWASLTAAEKTTCIGRMMLRLMISHFATISTKFNLNDESYNYEPIVGDTDGFNMRLPKKLRYTNEHPYIGKGLGRNVKKDKVYTGVEADVAEFEDMYLNTCYNNGIQRYGLDIDEYISSSCNVSRKNYCDKLPDGSIKLVGNTIKSRKMAGYLEKFINEGVELLLNGDGYHFLSNYYDYIDKIYNYQIPIKDIASKGNIKKTINEYKEDCKTLTKAGSKKSRQAWYELAINEGLNVNVGDSVYYINTGTKKGHSDVKRVTHYFMYDKGGNKVEISKDVEKLYKENNKAAASTGVETKKTRIEIAKEKFGSKAFEEDEIILNCKLVPMEIIDSEKDILCSEYEGLEYNVEKYIDQFNKRITPLLVCFSPEIRNKILVTKPKDRKFFTESESALVSGYPNKPEDQDTYEALMTPERKEIAFWEGVHEVPPFVKECGIDWDKLVAEYKEITKKENDIIFQEENQKYLDALDKLTDADIEEFETEAKLPSSITSVVMVGSDMRFYFKKLPEMTPSTGGYIFDDIQMQQIEKYEG